MMIMSNIERRTGAVLTVFLICCVLMGFCVILVKAAKLEQEPARMIVAMTFLLSSWTGVVSLLVMMLMFYYHKEK